MNEATLQARAARSEVGEAFIEAARELHAWVPASQALPPISTDVLVTDGEQIFIAFRAAAEDMRAGWWLNAAVPLLDDFVTHWQPLPPLP